MLPILQVFQVLGVVAMDASQPFFFRYSFLDADLSGWIGFVRLCPNMLRFGCFLGFLSTQKMAAYVCVDVALWKCVCEPVSGFFLPCYEVFGSWFCY